MSETLYELVSRVHDVREPRFILLSVPYQPSNWVYDRFMNYKEESVPEEGIDSNRNWNNLPYAPDCEEGD